ncbi:MAG: hypothetical protein IJU66_09060 [Oscillospiraceae bacterium]|nr:hypothetical protein [Oscillospiraceae bacterium]
MNRDIICIYYSRTGKTERVMREIAHALDCQVVEVHDRVRRGGALGALRCALDAMRRRTRAISRIESERQLWEYKLVILGTPVWAGRCSSVIRGLLKRRGYEMADVAYVITHKSDEHYREVFDQMDQYLLKPHVADVSLRPGSTGYVFWRNLFLKSCADFVGAELLPVTEEQAAEANREAAASDRPSEDSVKKTTREQ